jgi:hypothetical protein
MVKEKRWSPKAGHERGIVQGMAKLNRFVEWYGK